MAMSIDEKLIEMVRSYVEFYDLSHAKYMDSTYKDSIWRKIGDELNLTGKNCKARWNNIRDNFRKSIKKTTSGQAAKKLKKYKFDDQLQFLKPHLQERDTLGNIEDVEDDVDSNEDHVDISNENAEENLNENENAAVQNAQNRNGTDIFCGVEQSRSSLPVRKIPQKRSIKTPDSASTTLIKYVMQKKENNKPDTTNSNPVDAFLAGLSLTLKTFTPYYLNIVKSKIFSTVQEYEMKMILDEQQKNKSVVVPHFTVPSPKYQQLNENNQYLQEPRDMTSSTSHYLSSSPSPQFTKSNTQNHEYVQVSTLSPTASYCSSSPPSPHLNQNVSLHASQNLAYFQGSKDIVYTEDTFQ